MSREWKPGDVAMVTNGSREWLGLVRPRKAANDELEVAYATGGYDMVGDLADGYEIRPFVVIDPEDAAQVDRLLSLFWDNGTDECNDTKALTDALREFANPTPPKPAEPTGLGAVVEDVTGALWVQFSSKTGNWWRSHQGENARWTALHPVRVLSEGVTP